MSNPYSFLLLLYRYFKSDELGFFERLNFSLLHFIGIEGGTKKAAEFRQRL